MLVFFKYFKHFQCYILYQLLFFQETKNMSRLLYILWSKDVTNNFNITGEK